jgi:hypothetical protein
VLGDVTLAMQFETAAGRMLVRSSPATLTCTDPRLLVEFAFAVPSLPLPSPGWYRLALWLDGQRFAKLDLEICPP